ncbi:MAG TPA: rhomboid family intramembrane serine protease [Steroidobacteraceae bacterium]|nr:rhomboid family intramembrane serine protease [Steroidobacteraceae bacterium]
MKAWLAILIACIAGFLLQQSASPVLIEQLALWPLHEYRGLPQFEPWQLVTYAFLHGDMVHLFFNMFALYMFGQAIEELMGSRRFVAYYLVCVITAALAQLAVQKMMGVARPTVGASGGVFGLLLAYGMAFPHNRLMLIFPPIPMPAWLFVTLYGLLELYLGFSGRDSNVAHFAHLGGMAGGLVLLLYWRAQRRGRRRF